MKSKKSNNKLLFWGIPIVFLIAVGYFVFIFSRFTIKEKWVQFKPNKIIDVTEPFSGKVYFNNELGQNILSSIIINAIDFASTSIEIAVYSMDDEIIRDAIYNASKRGVKINIAFSDKHTETLNNLFTDIPKNINIKSISSNDSFELMHHKFMIIDRGESSQKLFFGSYNFTYIQDKYDPSFIFETDRREIIEIYGEEFDRIFSGTSGKQKLLSQYNPFAARINYPEGFLEIWFAPQQKRNGIKDRMIELIKQSRYIIKSMIWMMTDSDIASNLIFESRSKKVIMLIEDSNVSVKDSLIPAMLDQRERNHLNHLNNLEIITDQKRNEELRNKFAEKDLNSFLHQHLLIVDDEIVVFGTNNWSSGGFFRNDESIMVSNIKSLVSLFNESFDFNYNKNK